MDDLEKFIAAFREVKSRGFVPTNRSGNTGIGKTLEDYMNIPENNIDAPDLHGFELKSQRALSGSYITLFTKAPTSPEGVNTILREKYGTPDRIIPTKKVLHTSMFHNHYNTHKGGHGFKLLCDDSKGKIFLKMKSSSTGQEATEEIYWSYEVIQKILSHKLANLAFVIADKKDVNGVEYFYFKECRLFHGACFNKFLYLLKNDYIQFDIRIGIYRNGKNLGKTHDHGSGFRIKKNMMKELFESMYIIE